MRYEDFALQIRPFRPGLETRETYEVSAASSLVGEGRATLGLSEEARRVLDYLRYQRRGAFWEEGDGSHHPRSMGERLFTGIFAGDVRSLYDFCRGRLWPKDGETSSNCRLRIRLHFDPSDSASLHFNSVPWEVLF